MAGFNSAAFASGGIAGPAKTARRFIVTELPAVGGIGTPVASRFVWTNGGRSAPLQPWAIKLQQRTVRIDYPGGDLPTEQILGPNYEPFTLTGAWNDKFNFSGFAMETFKAFRAMVRRGNLCRFEFGDISFEGHITDLQVEYRRDWDIGYEFTVSPHSMSGDDDLAVPRSPDVGLALEDLTSGAAITFENASSIDDERDPHLTSGLEGSLGLGVSGNLDAIGTAFAEIDRVLGQRFDPTAPGTSFLRLSQQLAEIRGRAVTVLNSLIGQRSDTALAYETAMSTLNFETWARGVGFEMRRLTLSSDEAARQVRDREEPDALALYRPQAGESLYGVSNRFYKTPHNWRLIYERNGLDHFTMTGLELLVIPDANAG